MAFLQFLEVNGEDNTKSGFVVVAVLVFIHAGDEYLVLILDQRE